MQPKHIIIIGGGTAGWMCANLFAHQWSASGTRITVIESSQIGTVGVGEGSTPFLRQFFAKLNITEAQWMPLCDATYKCGIDFPNWCAESQPSSYFHPFYGEIDSSAVADFFSSCNQRKEGFECPSHPDDYFISAYLAKQARAPKVKSNKETGIDYAYHFDSQKLGAFLRNHALSLGVNLIDDKVCSVQSSNQGIESIETENNGHYSADLYVDCSGFKGLLIQQHLQEKLHDYSKYLPNNRAVALSTRPCKANRIDSYTLSAGLSNGWMWSIPLQHRNGNGYVYCDKYISQEQAEQELRDTLGEYEGDALHLSWTPGRIDNHWKQNCLAVGLSQGFLEPLEAPMLNIAQQTIEAFIEHYQQGNFSKQYQGQFNAIINNMIDGTRDYLQAHYKLSTRQDSRYWLDASNNPHISETLQALLSNWRQTGKFDLALYQHQDKLAYMKTSWYCILAGMGQFDLPAKPPLRLTRKKHQRAIDNCQKLAINFLPQQHYLSDLKEASL